MPSLDLHAAPPAVSLLGGVATAHLVLAEPAPAEWRIAYNGRAVAAGIDAQAIERDGATILLVQLPSLVGGALGLEQALSAAAGLLDVHELPGPTSADARGRDELATIEPLVGSWWAAFVGANAAGS